MILAAYAEPGMVFPSANFRDSLTDQTIRDVSWDPATNFVTVVMTNDARFDFLPDQGLVFPRRPSGRPQDWRGLSSPAACDVCPGDLLPSHDGDLVQSTPYAVSEGPQIVSSMRVLEKGATALLVMYTTQQGVQGSRSYVFAPNEPVVFPHAAPASLPRKRHEAAGELVWFGPYRHRETHALFMFSRHPHGRGRWPEGVPHYDAKLQPLPNDEAHRCRFPANDWDADLVPLTSGLPIGHVRGPARATGGKLTFK